MKKTAIAALLLMTGLVSSSAQAWAAGFSYKDGEQVKAGTVWSGVVNIEGIITVPDGVTLSVEPGTRVAFAPSERQLKDKDTSEVLIPGSGIRVEGCILAKGEKARPILFTSAKDAPAPGDWGCIFFDHSTGSVFSRCRFEYSTYTVHAHFSQFDITRSIITKNEDGSRIGLSKATIDHCEITDNTGKGLNFRQSRLTIKNCNITRNYEGIFLQEKDTQSVIEDNNIFGNKSMDLTLGEFHADDIALKGNWWGTADKSAIAAKVHDKEDDPGIGRSSIEPAASQVIGAGVDGLAASVVWKFKTGGFVDCSPAVSGGLVYFGSWDKKFYALKAATGELVWSFETGDCVDSSPAANRGRVFFGSWDRNLYCLDARTGKEIWTFQMPPSNFDDHRQASPAIGNGRLYMGGFNGRLYSIGLADGKAWWETGTGGPVRSRAVLFANPGSEGVVSGNEEGNITALDYNCNKLWQFETGSAVNSSPAIDGTRIIFGCRNGNLYCLNAADGKEFWRYPTNNRIEYSSPLVAMGLITIGDCSGTLHAVDRETGKAVWKYTGGGGIYSSPQLAGTRIIYGDNAGNVYCLDPKTGEPLGKFKAGDAVQGISAVCDGRIYAGSRDGFLYAITFGE
ncbi:MAG TPA: PQQ-binding-like beta-propeller repeat protein [Nitrospirota bacterium]